MYKNKIKINKKNYTNTMTFLESYPDENTSTFWKD